MNKYICICGNQRVVILEVLNSLQIVLTKDVVRI